MGSSSKSILADKVPSDARCLSWLGTPLEESQGQRLGHDVYGRESRLLIRAGQRRIRLEPDHTTGHALVGWTA